MPKQKKSVQPNKQISYDLKPASKKSLSIKTQFREAINYIRQSKHYIFASVILFIFASVVGFIMKEQLTFIDDLLRDLIGKTSDLDTFEMVFFILQNNALSSFLSMLLGAFLGFFPIVSDVLNGLVMGYVLARATEVAGILSWWRLLPHGIFELPAIFISFGVGIKWGINSGKKYFQTYKDDVRMTVYGVGSIIALVLGIFFSLTVSFNTLIEQKVNLLAITAFFVNLAVILNFLTLFIFNKHKNIREFQKKVVYNAMNTFLMVIVPLLIVAAIIEGLLIGFIS